MRGKYRLLAQGLDSINPEEYSEVIICADNDPDKLDALRRELSTTIWKMTGKLWRHGYFLIVDDKNEIWKGEEE